MVRHTAAYCLKFADDKSGPAKTVDFQAEDASEALVIARTEAADRDVELWKGNKLLCHLKHDEHEVWEIS